MSVLCPAVELQTFLRMRLEELQSDEYVAVNTNEDLPDLVQKLSPSQLKGLLSACQDCVSLLNSSTTQQFIMLRSSNRFLTRLVTSCKHFCPVLFAFCVWSVRVAYVFMLLRSSNCFLTHLVTSCEHLCPVLIGILTNVATRSICEALIIFWKSDQSVDQTNVMYVKTRPTGEALISCYVQ